MTNIGRFDARSRNIVLTSWAIAAWGQKDIRPYQNSVPRFDVGIYSVRSFGLLLWPIGNNFSPLSIVISQETGKSRISHSRPWTTFHSALRGPEEYQVCPDTTKTSKMRGASRPSRHHQGHSYLETISCGNQFGIQDQPS
ncbi:uncharacterized protein PADG_11718 [Paracoccidioides brasiliensis Pb18]|uniref:Uncharacterized protein n=1 Tax=Paracoccidioides brasiliensis (strain Pb18) TaxID=502780 RepID=A0A0A0HXT5_PARBD|nr:uncharacterized protein PADG_11718 [Paracoccidioides brasiliensis Pb18]KGM92180.1 hypothetical protein PADG_11718 [Paracoccidioides brasiliensis Pb18]